MGSDDEEVGRRLIALREHHKRNQTEFADTLNIAKNTLNGYERGERQLTIATAKRIRERWGTSVDWLLNGDIGQPGHELALMLGPKPEISSDLKPAKKRKRN